MAQMLSSDVATIPLADAPLEPTDVLAGTPTTAASDLGTVGGVSVGVWEITPGTVTDVEVDEVFVVLSGRATLEAGDTTIELAPGVAVRLEAGERTVWTVHETLRKIYVG